jgi:hypothetical protein
MNIAAMLTAKATKAQNSAIKAKLRKPVAPMKSAVPMQRKVKIVAMMTFSIFVIPCDCVVVGKLMPRFAGGSQR